MDYVEARKICTDYQVSVETGDEAAWRDCWAERGPQLEKEPQLIVAYGLGDPPPPFGTERHSGKAAIAKLIFGARGRLDNPKFTDDHIFLIANEPEAFFWQFHLEIKAKSGPTFDNDLLIKITVVNGKIGEFLEFGDPRRRGALFRYLDGQSNNIVDWIAIRLGTFAQRLLFILDDLTLDGLESPSTAYTPLKDDAYKPEQDLAEKYRSFVSEIMRLSMAGIGIFPFLIISIKSPMVIPPWCWRFAIVGVLFLAVSIFFAMRFLFGASEGLRWYIAGLRYFDANRTSSQAALDRRHIIIKRCRHDKFSAALCLIAGAVCMALATISAFT